ncbi:MAG: hypothetical protein RIT81_06715 [Deltaproteobacteria bacterium]
MDLTAPTEQEARAKVEAALPYCRDWWLVDRVVEQGDAQIVTRWTAPEAPYYRRGDDGAPLLLPGAIALEHLVQSGELLVLLERHGRPKEDGVPVLGRVRSASFRAMVPPGAQIESTLRLTDRVSAAYYVSAVSKVDGRVAVKAELTFTATDAIQRLTR